MTTSPNCWGSGNSKAIPISSPSSYTSTRVARRTVSPWSRICFYWFFRLPCLLCIKMKAKYVIKLSKQISIGHAVNLPYGCFVKIEVLQAMKLIFRGINKYFLYWKQAEETIITVMNVTNLNLPESDSKMTIFTRK